jgi:hypothetical protein
MYTAYYPERKTFLRYDSARVMVYLNEEVIEDYLPENAPEGQEPYTAYAYTGTEKDGGTLIEATEIDRDAMVNGIIRSAYTQSAEDAIKTHQIIRLSQPDSDKAEDYAKEWQDFNAFRQQAIDWVDKVLG